MTGCKWCLTSSTSEQCTRTPSAMRTAMRAAVAARAWCSQREPRAWGRGHTGALAYRGTGRDGAARSATVGIVLCFEAAGKQLP